MVEHTACVKKETMHGSVEEGAEEAPSVKVEGEMTVESPEEAKPDEEPTERVRMQCESEDSSTSREKYSEWAQYNEEQGDHHRGR